jgi:hypothetical protein
MKLETKFKNLLIQILKILVTFNILPNVWIVLKISIRFRFLDVNSFYRIAFFKEEITGIETT